LKYFKNISFYIVLFVMLLAFLVIVQSRPVEKEQKYSQLISDIHNGKVQEIILEDNKATVKYFMNEINDLIREGELEFRSKVPYSRRGGFLYCLLW